MPERALTQVTRSGDSSILPWNQGSMDCHCTAVVINAFNMYFDQGSCLGFWVPQEQARKLITMCVEMNFSFYHNNACSLKNHLVKGKNHILRVVYLVVLLAAGPKYCCSKKRMRKLQLETAKTYLKQNFSWQKRSIAAGKLQVLNELLTQEFHSVQSKLVARVLFPKCINYKRMAAGWSVWPYLSCAISCDYCGKRIVVFQGWLNHGPADQNHGYSLLPQLKMHKRTIGRIVSHA